MKFESSLATYTGIPYVLLRRKVDYLSLVVQLDGKRHKTSVYILHSAMGDFEQWGSSLFLYLSTAQLVNIYRHLLICALVYRCSQVIKESRTVKYRL